MATKKKDPGTSLARRAANAANASRPSNEPPVHDRSAEEIVALADPKANWTVNGRPFYELDAYQQLHMPYALTDQAMEERNEKNRDSKGNPHSGVKLLKSEGFDQAIAKRAHANEPWECENPLADAQAKYGRPGFRNRGLSPTVVQKRTLRGWEVVKDKNGDVVKVGNLLFGEMPEESAVRRNEYFRKQHEDELTASAERTKVNQERLGRDARSHGFHAEPLLDGDVLTDHADPDRQVSIGIHSQRGLQGADVAL